MYFNCFKIITIQIKKNFSFTGKNFLTFGSGTLVLESVVKRFTCYFRVANSVLLGVWGEQNQYFLQLSSFSILNLAIFVTRYISYADWKRARTTNIGNESRNEIRPHIFHVIRCCAIQLICSNIVANHALLWVFFPPKHILAGMESFILNFISLDNISSISISMFTAFFGLEGGTSLISLL